MSSIKHSYSVVIRTLGNTGDKYLTLLQSIAAQTTQPEEIIVVLPYGYSLDHQLGLERVVYSEKGMVVQRAIGIQEAKSDYILVVDDDLEFGPTMVDELLLFAEKHKLDCCLPMEGTSDASNQETINLKYSLATRLRSGFTGQLLTSYRKSLYLDKLTTTAGHKVFVNSNRLNECYLCETACFQCFLIKTEWAKASHFENAKYLQEGRLTSYSAYDEPTFFYPLILNGMRMAYALRTRYRHLDASMGHQTKSKLESKCIRYYSIARNRTMYWYLSLWKTNQSVFRKVHVLLGGLYAFVNYTLYSIVVNIRPKHWKVIHCLFLGYADAIRDIKKELNGCK